LLASPVWRRNLSKRIQHKYLRDATALRLINNNHSEVVSSSVLGPLSREDELLKQVEGFKAQTEVLATQVLVWQNKNLLDLTAREQECKALKYS
jgi:hypothetical protein